MRFPLPLGLVLAIGLSSVRALPPPANAPSPSPSQSASASPKPLALPVPSVAPTRAPDPDAKSAPPFPVPPPQVEREIPRPSAPPPIGFRSQPPSAAEIDRLIPKIEVWRTASNLPQKPKGRFQKARRLTQVYLVGADPVTVRLQFHPLSRGKAVLVRAARGIILDPPDELLSVPADGKCLVSLRLDA